MIEALEQKARIGMPYELVFRTNDLHETIWFRKKGNIIGTIRWHEGSDALIIDEIDFSPTIQFRVIGKIFRRYFNYLSLQLNKEVRVPFIEHRMLFFKNLGYEHIKNDEVNCYVFRGNA